MMIEALYAIGMSAVTIAFAYLAARAWYRCAIFGLMREHREVILKHAYLLDEKHGLSDVEVRSVSSAITHLYDYDYKSLVAKGVLDAISHHKECPSLVLREEVRRVSKAFAALVLVENPFNAMAIMRKLLKMQRDTKQANNGTMPLARAENIVASQIPVEFGHRRSRELAMC